MKKEYVIETEEAYGHTVPALRRSAIAKALQELQESRERRRGMISVRRARCEKTEMRSVNAAFARAEREQRELQRLKGLCPQWSGLHFHPGRLGETSGRQPERQADVES